MANNIPYIWWVLPTRPHFIYTNTNNRDRQTDTHNHTYAYYTNTLPCTPTARHCSGAKTNIFFVEFFFFVLVIWGRGNVENVYVEKQNKTKKL